MKRIFKAKNYEFELGKKTYIMGILNITPDSFSDGGMWQNPEKALKHSIEMVKNGADIIDIGAQSTRPGHISVSAEEEIERLSKILPKIKNNIDVPISVDTYYPQVASHVMKLGASIINDVSGLVSEEMAEVVKENDAGWIIMHTGVDYSQNEKKQISNVLANLMKSKEMVAEREYEDSIAENVKSFFKKSFFIATSMGVNEENICFDCGMGFGKSYEQNIELLRDIKICKFSQYPLLVASSRKRFIGEATGETDAKLRLAGTIAADTIAIAGGADFIRVHDVKQAAHAAKMADKIYRAFDEV